MVPMRIMFAILRRMSALFCMDPGSARRQSRARQRARVTRLHVRGSGLLVYCDSGTSGAIGQPSEATVQ
ncbi:hypothetical protein [Lysobacter gummosus]|uniref:hypothetical protein n=1 Tax=Lysobacter gummosus TaxID=262324 RepID=UPI003638DACE